MVGRMGQSPDAIVRAAASSALGILIKRSNMLRSLVSRFDRAESSRNSQCGDSDAKTPPELPEETGGSSNDAQVDRAESSCNSQCGDSDAKTPPELPEETGGSSNDAQVEQ